MVEARVELEAIYRGMGVTRFHCFRTIHTQNNGEHSAGVAHLYDYLAGSEATYQGLIACLRHDLAEYLYGDMPAPAKRDMPPVVMQNASALHAKGDIVEFRQYFGEQEDLYLANRGIPMPDLSEKDQRWLKMADSADGAIFCIREAEMGNLRMRDTQKTFVNYFQSLIWNTDIPKNAVERREDDLLSFIKQGL